MLSLFLLANISVFSNFEGGSVGRIEKVSPSHLRCAVVGQADQEHRNRQANWYYFRLENLLRIPVSIDLVDLAGEYNYVHPVYAVTARTRPVFSYDEVTWRHFPDSQLNWDAKEPHLTITFTPERNRIWIAHVPPYTNKRLGALLTEFKASPFLERRSVGRTVEGREMTLLTIVNPKVVDPKKKVIWLMFRQHAWETGSSWAGEGAIRFLLSNNERAIKIRGRTMIKIFPLADPDGVADGGVRFNRHGYDLNRNWDTIDPVKMPEIAAQHGAILEWVNSGHRLDCFLSLHNTENGEYLESPAVFKALGERIFQILKRTTTFNPTSAPREQAETTTPGKPGRMTVAQGLFHDRKLPAMLMEQMIEYNSKLGRCPTVSDRVEFGSGLVQALVEAVNAQP